MNSWIPLFAPLISIFLIRYLLKAVGLGDLMKPSSAAMMASTGAMKMAGQDKLATSAKKAVEGDYKKDKNGIASGKRGLGHRFGLDKADRLAARTAATTKKGLVAGKDGVKAGISRVAGEGSALDQKTGMFDAAHTVFGQKDSQGNVVTPNLAQAAFAKIKSHGTTPDSGSGVQIAGSLTSQSVMSTGAGSVKKNQSVTVGVTEGSLTSAPVKDDQGNKLSLNTRKAILKATRAINNETAQGIRHFGQDGPPLNQSTETLAAIATEFEKSHSFDSGTAIVGSGVLTPLPNFSHGRRAQATEDGTVEAMRHPMAYFPDYVTKMQEGESGDQYIRRMRAFGSESGHYDMEADTWVDMLASNNHNTSKLKVREMVLSAAASELNAKTSPELAALSIKFPASTVSSVARTQQVRISMEAADRQSPFKTEVEATEIAFATSAALASSTFADIKVGQSEIIKIARTGPTKDTGGFITQEARTTFLKAVSEQARAQSEKIKVGESVAVDYIIASDITGLSKDLGSVKIQQIAESAFSKLEITISKLSTEQEERALNVDRLISTLHKIDPNTHASDYSTKVNELEALLSAATKKSLQASDQIQKSEKERMSFYIEEAAKLERNAIRYVSRDIKKGPKRGRKSPFSTHK